MNKDNIFWIGGSSCSGKSSISTKISKEMNIELYKTDDYAFGKYMFELENEDNYPAIKRYKNLLMEGIDNFRKHNVDELVKSFTDYCAEVFPLLLNDIIELSRKQKIIVEGAHLLPEILDELKVHDNCIFLLSSKDQQRKIWLKEMKKEISGGHPAEIENYNNSNCKNEIEDFRVGFHDRIKEHIRNNSESFSFEYVIINKNSKIEEVKNSILLKINECHFKA